MHVSLCTSQASTIFSVVLAHSTMAGVLNEKLVKAEPKLTSCLKYDESTDAFVSETVEDEEEPEIIVKSEPFYVALLIIISSAVAATVAFGVGQSTAKLAVWKADLLEMTPDNTLATKIGWAIGLLLITRIIIKLEPKAAGSGVPEIRCMLGGYYLHGILRGSVGVAKAVGLTLAIAAGLPLGTEGPFIHFSACISAAMKNVPPFKRLNDDHIRFSLLMAMTSVGAGCTLSAPIAGALFGLELMLPHIVSMYSYKELFLASSAGSLAAVFLRLVLAKQYKPLFTSDVSSAEVDTSSHLLRFMVLALPLACISGACAGLFVHFQNAVATGYKKMRGKCPKNLVFAYDMCLIATVATLVTALASFEPMFGLGPAGVLNAMFSVKHLPELKPGVVMGLPSLSGLGLLFLARFVFTAASIRLPIPSGCVGPSLAIGAVLGRFYGHLVLSTGDLATVGESGFQQQDFAWLAIIGASTFAASICRTYSIVVLVFELCEVGRLILPLSISTLVAMAISNHVAPSIFDSITAFKSLPNLVGRKVQWDTSPVETLMQTDFKETPYIVPRTCTVAQFRSFVKKVKEFEKSKLPSTIAVVEPDGFGGKPFLLGVVETAQVLALSEAAIGTDLPTVDAPVVAVADSKSNSDDVMGFGDLCIAREKKPGAPARVGAKQELVDVLKFAVTKKLLHRGVHVKPGTKLKDACLISNTARVSKKEANLYICENGVLDGIITTQMLHTLEV